MTFSRNSLPFRERAGLARTVRAPLPAASPSLNAASGVPVAPPHPEPYYLGATQGSPSPDRGRSSVWPFGDEPGP